jgi:hypothetical protein
LMEDRRVAAIVGRKEAGARERKSNPEADTPSMKTCRLAR